MARVFDIIDHHEEKLRKQRRILLMITVVVSLGIFSYPQVKKFEPKWNALNAARKLSLYIQGLKTQAIIHKKPVEIRFSNEKTIEVYEVSSCGPHASKNKILEKPLLDFAEGIVFPSIQWVNQNIGTEETIMRKFCYDPLFGSSLAAEGIMHGSVFLAHGIALQSNRPDLIVRLQFSGNYGDMELE